ncbi:molybdenum cofactor biosynthesis protein MoaE [Pseudoclavibacter sp. VKM Ac-2888]|uniref:molybdenum cofactor biosynthesis protein MoaE n=1 Tax=Pseudoclavibacter sp. VKM Ac-2888 TaxID=2783830 RepID=UPI00188CCD6E|nr:molybdenum cofactor biosynthesis protein MoaE [Pseudoclavibacter sp. VKM Ac-2888]MBF4548654.1 molybdenum cofactor biosynthesis protein MoaE [Pseudoclavibacter sp. VKM Ac-2888]
MSASPLARVTSDELLLAEHLAAVEDPHAGAVVTFVGQIRDHDPEASGRVVSLDYTAHPDAEHVLESLVADHARDGVRVAVSHRIGHLRVGDIALIACVASAHRGDAYEVSRALVEAVKAEVPIWKQQHEVDGATSWVGLP